MSPDDHASKAQIETHSEPDISDHDHGHGHGGKPHESPWVMLIPLVVLAVGAVASGFLFEHDFVGEHQAEFWRGAIVGGAHVLEEAHHAPLWVVWAPVVVTLIGLAAAAYVYLLREGLGARLFARHGIGYGFLYKKWFFDELYDRIFVRVARWTGDVFWRGGDQKVIDGLGPNGVAAVSGMIGRRAGLVQTGYMYHYAFVMLLGVAGLLTFALVAWS